MRPSFCWETVDVLMGAKLLQQGHSKSIQCLTVHRKDGRPHIYSGSHDGHINILPLRNRVFLYRTKFTVWR